ncbi:ribosome biogenesis GTP-binding protein YihA/YsxC [Peptoniphilus stercorisuis]|uniref:Probable GTP-binding protein EngB n=1 Tax=Peptoniphilus stercorisuis TaxID=1436965 RepID=A0ABS4KE91_9FIRM|nr:ribosome biogenesis GTP-binding protein YihA/YsxC [Peptoniphilus stercorisuis]MBP2026060.1 GTP-binding protein [Peptoniphilus stercorisuis]
MKIKTAELDRVAVKKSQYPDGDLPEFAFAGRSNVGKSSFINAILNRKKLARTSSTPGKTRTINFYKINDALRLVDLPGYGYAKVSKSAKSSWADSINEYLESRDEIYEVFLLVDIRHEPTSLDARMYDFILQNGFTGIVIATKSDKISKGQYAKNINIIAKKLKIKNKDLIVPFSSEKKDMVDEIWFILEDIMKFHKED